MSGSRWSSSQRPSRSWEGRPATWDPADVRARLEDTIAGWASWSESHQRYEGPYRDLVCFSGSVLQGLTFQPTGAIVAAPTTSLPETVGGDRNWGDRYGWLRCSDGGTCCCRSTT